MTTLVPEVEVNITTEDFTPPVGSAGVTILCGNFERAKEGKKYPIKNLKQSKALLGSGYNGNKCLELLFSKHEDPNTPNGYVSKGATKVIAYQLGTRTGATLTLQDDEATPADTLKLTLGGGLFGNNKKITISEGNISGQTVTILDEDGTELKSYVDVRDKKDFIRRINKDPSPLIVEIEDLNPEITSLANTTSAKFTGGVEDNTITNETLISALESLEETKADFFGTSEILPNIAYELICEWADTREKSYSPILPVLAVPSSLSYNQKRQLGIDLLTKNRVLIDGISNDYNEAETTALIIGLAAGMNVSDSPDFPVISPINYVESIYSKPDKIDLTDAGITVFDVREEERNQYGLNLAVTGEQRILDNGNKCHYMHMYIIRTLHYCIKFLDLTNWLRDTKRTATIATSNAELGQRINKLKDAKVIKEGTAECFTDEENPTELNIVFKVKVGAILLKVNLYVDLSIYQ